MDTGQARNRESAATDWLFAEGDMGRLIRAKDWSQTAVGPPEGWPQSLKTALGIMLHSRYQMFVWWGAELTYFYNDAYIPVLGKRHPWALGQSPRKVWPEIWDTIGAQAEIVVNEGRATWNEQLELIMERNGYTEETFFTFSYSPIPDDTGRVAGVYCACSEETHRVLGERRLGALRHLASATADSKSVEAVCEVAARTLEEHGRDASFALIYFINRPGGQARLVASCGLAPGGELAPHWVELSETARPAHFWPFMEAISGHAVVVRGLQSHGLPGGPWPESTNTAVVLPLAKSGHEQQPAGFLIVGASPRREFEDQYQGFFELVAGSIASAIANARSYEEERGRAEALAEIDRAKTAFFSNVSHEFRTPLTLMLGPLEETLSDQQIPLALEHRERLKMVHRNSLRLQKLVNTLLDFSRIEAGRIQAIYEPVDLARFTIELASTFRSAVERADMRLVVNCEALEEPVFVDRDMWEKIVLNLLSNAFKFTLEGEIEVALRQVGRTAQLTVRDTGTGISAEQLPHIFERFHRVEGTRARTHEGTGIGLALVQELVRLHGGTATVRSVYGVGTTLTVTIPLGWAHLPAERLGGSSTLAEASRASRHYAEEANRWVPESSRETADQAQDSALPAGRSRILLADDNADMRDYVHRLLFDRYEVEAVPDGEAALAAIRRQAPDIVLIDVMMPKIDGFELLAALRNEADTRTLPIIMLSARAGEEARIEGLNAGADDYLIKPFSARELQARVAAHLETARLRKEAEQAIRDSELRFRTMADTAPAMLWVTDSKGECTFLSRGWYEFTGLGEITGLGNGWKDATHPDDREKVGSEFMTAASKHEPFAIDYRLRRSDCEYRWVIDSGRPRFSESGEFLGYIGSIIDITERKQYEVALKDADRRKDEFLATLAHELRNPLAPILNAVDILKTKGPPGRELQWSQDIIARQVKHMARLLDDLLDVSRITLDKLELRPERVALETVIQNALEASRPLVSQRGQDLKVTLPPDPVYLNGDPTRLAQVFLNLLENAAKFTRQGGQIWLTTEVVPSSRHGEEVGVSPSETATPFSAPFQPEEPHVVVRVRDSGIGIPNEMLSKVFEMFTQVERSVERSYGGLGLGLTLVKRLVELHGGSVEARSDNSGSEFIVRLPVLESSRLEDPVQGAQIKPALTKPRSRRVLVVDDNPDAVETLSILLQLRRNDVLTAVDGLEAVEAAAAFQPDLILLDIGLPKLNGYDAARRIREQRSDNRVVIVAMTGWGQEEDKRKSKEAGFDQHLVKPVDPALLEELLASAPILD